VETRYTEKLSTLEHRLLHGPGTTESEVRRSVASGDRMNDPLVDAYLEKIRNHAYKIVERDIAELKAAGWDEDQIFEISICTAFGAARQRLDAGLRAVELARSTAGPPQSGPSERSE